MNTPNSTADSKTDAAPSGHLRLWRRIKPAFSLVFSSATATVGLAIVVFWILVAIFAPWIAPMGPLEQDITAVNSGPTSGHILGTDDLGRDILARIAFGTRRLIILAPLAVFLGLSVGTAMGVTSGYYGGWADEIIMRIIDALMAFPAILLYLVIIATFGPSAVIVVIAIAMAGIPASARLVRSLTLDIRTREYVAEAKLRGESPLYILSVEILLNALGPILVDGMLRVGYAIIAIGTLGFLGIGLPPPAPDWGSMVARARPYMWLNPWAVLWPSLAIISLVVALNLIVDGVRERM